MDSKRTSRRKFLAGGAAVAGLAATTMQSASGQASASEAHSEKSLKTWSPMASVPAS